MKYSYTRMTVIAILFLATTNAQTGNIRFTAKKNPSQENQIFIYGKNFSGAAISGIIGASNITLCVAFPNTSSATPSITSPIAGQLFEAPLNNTFGSDSLYSWNGKGATSAVDFPADGTTEVHLATVTFNTGNPGVTATVKIADIALSGPSGFDYCYIAPGGVEHSGYSTPFYSNIPADPLLMNSGGTNDVLTMSTSTLGIASVALPVKFLGFNVVKKNNDGFITWQIENESSITDRYEIERSLNGVDFKKVYTVIPKNNGSSTNSYDLTDANLNTHSASGGIFYYRIKQIDKDGKFVYTSIKKLRLTSKAITVAVFPNPVKNFATVSIDIEQDTKGTITINDASGKQIQNIQIPLFKGPNIRKIDMGTLASGSYMLKVQTPTETEIISVVKTN